MNLHNNCSEVLIRAATGGDSAAIWKVIEPSIRAGETYTLPRDLSEGDTLDYWFSLGHAVFVALHEGEIVGSYYLRANHAGAGSHVANCGYMTGPWASGRGVARAMCRHSLDQARTRGFLAMQFNIVVSTNERAVRLWQFMGFRIIGRIPQAFRHPTEGLVEAFVYVSNTLAGLIELGIRLLSAHPGVTPEVQSLAIDYDSKRDPVRICRSFLSEINANEIKPMFGNTCQSYGLERLPNQSLPKLGGGVVPRVGINRADVRRNRPGSSPTLRLRG